MTRGERVTRLHIRLIKSIVVVLALFLMVFSVASVTFSYRAQSRARVFLAGSEEVKVSDKTSDIYFDGYGTDVLLILYGGAFVEERAYSELGYRLAEAGIDTVIVKTPFELPILKQNAADSVRKRYPHNRYYIGGHSMGGAFSCMNAVERNNAGIYEGVVLLAAYPATSLSNSNLKVLSIYGSNDTVLNLGNYNTAKKSMPEDFTEYVIEGGNHANFGDYGEQRGDSEAETTAFKQKDDTIQKIKEFIFN